MPFKSTLKRFKKLPETTRAMIYLFWVYEFAELAIAMFLGIFLFLQTGDLMSMVYYHFWYFSGILIGFCFWGYLIAQLQISLRLNYLKAFIVYILSFAFLILFPHTTTNLYIFGALNGLGLGMFWIGVHSYEMLYTNKENRDFYSSMVSAGGQVLSIVAPLFATLTFVISDHVLKIETFQLLFWLIPITYLFSIPFLFKLPDLVPPKIKKGEFKRLLTDKSQRNSQVYYIIQSLDWAIWSIIYPVMAIISLTTVVNVGLLETVTGLLALLMVLLLAKKRHSKNRVWIQFACLPFFLIAYGFLFFWEWNPLHFIVFTVIVVLLDPIWRVTEHVVDLHSVELASKESHFFPALIYRDFILGIGRLVGVIGAGLFIHWNGDQSSSIQVLIACVAVTIVCLPFITRRVNEQS